MKSYEMIVKRTPSKIVAKNRVDIKTKEIKTNITVVMNRLNKTKYNKIKEWRQHASRKQ